MTRLLLVLAAVLALAAPARAQVISEPAPPPWPDPKKFAKGLFASGEAGALIFVGKAGRYAAPGAVLGVRVGYDIFRWLDAQLHIAGATSDATTPPPTSGQAFQTLLYSGEVRFKIAIRRVSLFAEGGAGLGQITTNVLDQVGITTGELLSFAVIAGGGVDYHTLNRHFSVGLGADYLWLQAFSNTSAVTVQAYLRYTR